MERAVLGTMPSLLIKNGRVIDPASGLDGLADVLIEDGHIQAVGRGLERAGAVTKNSEGEALAAIGSMKNAGIVAISDDGRPVMNARVMRRAMQIARSFDLPVIDHCEDLNLSAGGDMHEGVPSTRMGLRGIPASSEDVMVARDILLAESSGARFHVAHISSRNSVAMVAHAKKLGLAVTCEATPHHFAITDADVASYDSNYKMKPPLRSECEVEAVIGGIVSGAIDVIATDH